MRKLLIATRNPAKLGEFKNFLKDLPLQLVSLNDLGIEENLKETGKTFTENAQAKALFFSKKSQLPTLADDGGIEIDALNGEPGVKSRRWINGGTDAKDEDLIDYALKRMEGVPISKRQAHFRAVLALAIPQDGLHFSEGIIKGIIAEKPLIKRKAGYPYRSLFYLPQIKRYYFEGELSQAEQKLYNHRYKAIRKLIPILKRELC